MEGRKRTNDQLMNELREMRKRIVKLEAIEIEHRQMEKKLRESEERLRNMFNSSPTATTVIDSNGSIIGCNRAALDMHGFSAEKEMLGKSSFELIAPKDRRRATEDWKRIVEEGLVRNLEYAFLTKSGRRFAGGLSARVIRDSSGRPECFVATSKDITDRKETENQIREYTEKLAVKNRQLKVETERAKEGDRLKSEFLAGVSHEVRSPLTTINGAAYLLEKGPLSKEQRNLCTMIRDSGEYLLQIINDILDLARIEAGQVRLEEKDFSMKDLVEETVLTFDLRAKEKRLGLNIIYSADLPAKIRADQRKLTEILHNLVDNALKFTEKGEVGIRLAKLSDFRIRLQVKDTGIGVSEKEVSRLFDKFYQAAASNSRKYKGTGLGLTLVKELARLMEGEIEVKSKLAEGSTFSFTFPYKPVEQRTVGRKDRAELEPKITQKSTKDLNILIAEDDDSCYYVMERFLRDYTTSRAVNGKDVLEKIKNKSYNLVLMDIQMPELDGLEATREIRQRGSELPIIALTGKAMKGDREKCLEAGCDDYISKPVAPDELRAKIDKYAGKRFVTRQKVPLQKSQINRLLPENSGNDKNSAKETRGGS